MSCISSNWFTKVIILFASLSLVGCAKRYLNKPLTEVPSSGGYILKPSESNMAMPTPESTRAQASIFLMATTQSSTQNPTERGSSEPVRDSDGLEANEDNVQLREKSNRLLTTRQKRLFVLGIAASED